MHLPFPSSTKCLSPTLRTGLAPWCRRGSIRELSSYDAMIMSLMLWTFVHTTEALAGDTGQVVGADLSKPVFDLPRSPPILLTAPLPLQPDDRWLRLPDPKPSANHEFRARGPSLMAPTQVDFVADDFQHDSLWQRLGQFRSRNRLCLLTLWQTGGSSLSLQAGRRGDPTLQWTSRMTRSDGAPGGLFDELFSTSVGGAFGKGFRFLSRGAPVDTALKPSRQSSDASLLATVPGK